MNDLEQLFRAVLAQLELASHTASSHFDSQKITHGKASATAPPRVDAPYLLFRTRFEGCRTDEQKRNVITDALKELRSVRFSKRAAHTGTREGRRLIGLDPRPVSVLVDVYGYSREHIYRLRREARKEAA